MHIHLHRTPQPTLSRRSPPTHATHGMRVSPNPRQQDSDKQFLRIAYHDMHTVSHAHTDIHSLIPRLSLSVHTDVHNTSTPTRFPPVIRVTALPRANVCHTHSVYYSAPLPRSRVFRVSLFHSSRQYFRLHPPSPAPRPHRPPASGRRVSSHLFPRAYLRVPVI